VVEGAPLLREYGVYSSIEGSTPSLSAIYAKCPYATFGSVFWSDYQLRGFFDASISSRSIGRALSRRSLSLAVSVFNTSVCGQEI
jgi:G:T/U-mismatch repair DNA glycosylase